MKKKTISAIAVLTAAAVLCGCNVTINTPAGTDKDTPAQEVATDTGADKGASYDPESFSVTGSFETPEQAPDIDISGCDTFTQIVDKLEAGKGYATTSIWDTDALLISSGTYEWEPGKNAAIDAAIYVYKDGTPTYLGTVCAGGTAYPLAIGDKYLYVGGNHFVTKYLIDNDALMEVEEAYVVYDTDGNETNYYRTCNSQFEDYDEATAKSNLEGLFGELESADVIEFQPVGGEVSASGKIPAYEYPGPELFFSVLYDYMIKELGSGYPQSDVCIPCPVIIEMDESDNSDIRVYGNFWIFNYDLKGDILENTSGGSFPGCIHVKSTDAGYEVTSMEVCEDGSGFDESAKKIFGKYYDKFAKDGEDEKQREQIRAQIIANYVAANNLSITAYQDYGWDPVTLPEENIDSFYSRLD